MLVEVYTRTHLFAAFRFRSDFPIILLQKPYKRKRRRSNSMKLSKCFHCNGYYGPSFGQPVCSTCHMFLYPDDSSLHSSSFHCHDLKVEDGDSGNEEPKEPSECNVSNDLPGSSSAAEEVISRNEGMHHQPEPKNLQAGITSFCSPQEPAKESSNGTKKEISLINASSCEANMRPQMESSERVSQMLHSKRYEILPRWDELPPEQQTLTGPSPPSRNQVADIHSIPPEVLLVVFQLLDEVSLWSVGQVCKRWSQLVSSCTLHWKVFIQRRWPLFNPIYSVTNWHKVFTNLIESAPCQLCLFRMPYNTIPAAHEDSWRRKRLSNERRTLRSDPPEGINAFPLDKMSLHWQASIRGPAGSPYQGGTFFLYIQIPSNYPLSPPLVRFITRIFHPNVSRHGDIGIDSIQHNWSVAITISKVLVSIQSLLTDPYTKVCMEPRIGEMYDDNISQFDRIAKAWTWCYAMHDAIDPESVVPEYLHRLTSDRWKDQVNEEEELETRKEDTKV